MPHQVPRERLALIETIVAAAARGTRAPPGFGAAGLRQYFRGVSERDLGARPPRELRLIAEAHFRLGARRRSGQALVRVFNPDPAGDGFAGPASLLAVVTDDMPFLVDSLRMVLERAGLGVRLLIHPVLEVNRDRQGRITGLPAAHTGAPGPQESWQLVELDRALDPPALARLEDELRAALDDVRIAVDDWQAMRRRLREATAALAAALAAAPASTAATAESAERLALLDWMETGQFVFLGYSRLRGGRASARLGILRASRGAASAEPREAPGTPLLITKSERRSTVHRAAYLDEIIVTEPGKRGQATLRHRFLGLWTSGAYHSRPAEIPLVRRKVAAVLERFGLDPRSHDGSAVRAMLETWPRDELFQASLAELVDGVRAAVNLYERHSTRLLMRRDPLGRFCSCMVFVPRDRYTTEVRRQVEGILQRALSGSSVESEAQVAGSAHARLRIIVHGAHALKGSAARDALEREIAFAATTWADRLETALAAAHEPSAAARLVARYARAFPLAYQEQVEPEAALEDIAALESLGGEPRGLRLALQRLHARPPQRMHLRLLQRCEPIPLSDLLPVLENFGLRVIAERPYALRPEGAAGVASVQDLEFEHPAGALAVPATVEARFAEAFASVWRGALDNDGFNRLLLLTGLDAASIEVLRACCRYLLQTGIPFSQSYMERTLAAHPGFAAGLFTLFDARLSPGPHARPRAAREARLAAALRAQLEAVSSADEDRILRGFLAVVEATLRSNFHQRLGRRDERGALALKLDPQRIPHLPLPRPRFEIFVHSPRVEGVHLRMARVARGGIRWSDRREDFRTEVLGLMKAQHVKNTLIVPSGAKGGFVPRRLPAQGSREDLQREGIAAYQTFIHALLDVTDNLAGSEVLPPPATHRRDADDPYLVVAADKGTASFSDIANAIAVERGFWLGDAFASGGSAGYDHKKMGITARGAWECVKRHFRELGLDTQEQAFTVAGIGDMSGDVFGNGMLLSAHTRLVAAFNHQHVFLDPEPDAARSFAERRRLFDLPRSGWNDYDTRTLSRGGGVFPRTAKVIPLAPECRQLLGIDATEAAPNEVIRAILRLPVDLLWNGGIGTYVKAGTEPQSAAGDRGNDAVRVDGRELRARVVGEGGNLGFTQLGRVEYALHGGRINTDFIDNSAGVNTSDLEVNLKILTTTIEARGGLRRRDRDRLLAGLTGDIAALVLRNNYLQGQALSGLQRDALQRLPEMQHLMRTLERAGELDRSVEYLPQDAVLEERRKQGHGLTRPELAVLLSYSKISLKHALIASDAPEDPYLSRELERYFPPVLRRRFAGDIPRHPLRREIVVTALTNSIVNRMGPSFVTRAQEETGASAAEIARAYTIAREVFDMRRCWESIEALDNRVPAAVQYGMHSDTARLLRHATYWLLRHRRTRLGVEAGVADYGDAITELTQRLPALLSGGDLGHYAIRRDALLQEGVPAALASRVALADMLDGALDIAELARQQRIPLADAAAAHVAVGENLGLDWLRRAIDSLQVDGAWQVIARNELREAARQARRAIAREALAGKGRRTVAQRLAAWATSRATALESWQRLLADLRAMDKPDFATLSVGVAAARELAG